MQTYIKKLNICGVLSDYCLLVYSYCKSYCWNITMQTYIKKLNICGVLSDYFCNFVAETLCTLTVE